MLYLFTDIKTFSKSLLGNMVKKTIYNKAFYRKVG